MDVRSNHRITDCLEHCAETKAEKVAFTYLADGEDIEINLTWRELCADAKAIASRLRKDRTPGARVILLYPPGTDFIKAFFACLYADLIAVPCPLTGRGRWAEAPGRIAADCGATLILTSTSGGRQHRLEKENPGCRVLCSDLIGDDTAEPDDGQRTKSDIAFLQYTSGSSGKPKGVMVTHDNVICNQELIKAAFRQDEKAVIVSWLPFHHDMGLIGNILHTVYLGAKCVLMAPSDFIQRPLRWLKAIHKYKGTTSGGPDFAYELCAKKISDDEKKDLDLSSWKTAYNGAEPVRAATLREFAAAFGACGFKAGSFQACYGMAEATLLIAAAPNGDGPRTIEYVAPGAPLYELVSCGRPYGYDVQIVDGDGKALKEKEVGEIWINGNSVARGYWGDKQENASFDHDFQGNERRYFRTGDLGMFEGGELFICGRIKDLIILNGVNYYPGDIEEVAAGCSDLIPSRGCAAFTIEKEQKEKLVVVCEVDNDSAAAYDHICRDIASALSEAFGIGAEEIVLIRKGTLAKTTSGKVRRPANKDLFANNALNIVYRSPFRDALPDSRGYILSPTEKRILDAVREVSGIGDVHPDDALFSAGLDSIKMVQLAGLLPDIMDDYTLLFSYPTIRSLAGFIDARNSSGQIIFRATVQQAVHDLSTVQKAMWYDQQLKGESTCYNLPVVLEWDTPPDLMILEKTLNEIIREQEILRTSFPRQGDRVVQLVGDYLHVGIKSIDLSSPADVSQHKGYLQTVRQEANKYIDVTRLPLFHLTAIRLDDGTCKLLLVAHHLIADGYALMLLSSELRARYDATVANRQIPSRLSSFQYRDYIAFDALRSASPEMEATHQYWLAQLRDAAEFKLPYDFPRTDINDRKGASVIDVIHRDQWTAVDRLARQHGVTVYTVLQCAFVLLMSKFSRRKEVILGMPVAGRDHPALRNMLGIFVNTVLLRYKLADIVTIEDLLSEIKTAIERGLRHHRYSPGLIAEQLGLGRRIGGFPFTAVFFNGLLFLENKDVPDAFGFFPGNTGIDMNVDLNCYITGAGDVFHVRMDYRTACFRETTVKLLLKEFKQILGLVTQAPGTAIAPIYNARFSRLSADEKARIIQLSSGETRTYPPGEHIASLVEKQAAATPERTAIVCGGRAVTYRDANGKANHLAKLLRERGVRQGDFVAMFMDKGLEIPICMLALLKIGAPFVPIDLDWPVKRIDLLMEELEPALLVFNKGGRKVHPGGGHEQIEIAFDLLDTGLPDTKDSISLDTPIYGMYTSGTTGMPKCTVNIQRGILNRLLYMNKRYGQNKEESVLFASKYDYDACVWQMFWPLLNGGKTVIPTPAEDMDFHALIDLIEQEQVTFTDFVPSVFSVFVDYLEISGEKGKTKASSLRQLLIGGEAMNPKAIRRFREMLPEVGITNTYGATEASMGTVFFEISGEIGDNIPIGRPIDNVKALLLDEELQPVAPGEPGELYLGGDCVGLGYLKDETRTNASFIPNPVPESGQGTLYRTGDMARFENGNILYIGRRDLQVKINGVRIELGEIEASLLKHEHIHEAVVLLDKKDPDDAYLVAYIKTGEAVDPFRLNRFLSQWLPDHMLPAAYVKVREFPRIGIGKVDKRALAAMPNEKLKMAAAYEAPATRMEERLAALWSGLLNRQQIGRNDDFFSIGGNSLKAMQLQTRIQADMGYRTGLREIFTHPILADLALSISASGTGGGDIIPLAGHSRSYLLTDSQFRLWVLSQAEDSSCAYNIQGGIDITGDPDTTLLHRAIQYLISRHESLRTVFREAPAGEIRQYILPSPPVYNVQYPDLSRTADADKDIREFALAEEGRPFDLGVWPLFRISVLARAPRKYVLLITMHHIISDGWSVENILRELSQVYSDYAGNREPSLTPLRIQYKDYAAWENTHLQSTREKQNEEYWLNQLGGELPVLQLPFDKTRPAVKTYKGDTIITMIPSPLVSGLRALCSEEGATLFMGLLAGINAVLYRYTGQDDIVLGTPVATRDEKELEHQVGLYLNTLAIRTRVRGNEPFSGLLRQVKELLLGAYTHKAYPFARLVDRLDLPTDNSRSALFDILVVLQNQVELETNKRYSFEGLDVTVMNDLQRKTSQFDITFEFEEQADGQLLLNAIYNPDIFSRDNIRQLLDHLIQFLDAALAGMDTVIDEIDYLDAEETDLLVRKVNPAKTDVPAYKSITALFEEQVRLAPDSVALVYNDQRLDYKTLHELSGQLAWWLHTSYDLGPGSLAGIMLERSEWMVISMLAVLKTGAGYVPIDPAYPQQRIDLMVGDSGCKVIIDEDVLRSFRQQQAGISPGGNGFATADGSAIAYIIYTSGTTGRPKGVKITHSNVFNLLSWALSVYSAEEISGVLAGTSICFDLSVFEIFLPLAGGGTCILANNAAEIDTLPGKQEITLINTVPSVAVELARAGTIPLSVSVINLAGEALRSGLVRQLYAFSQVKKVYNLYGPTETTTYSTAALVSADDDEEPSIGEPIRNTRLYVLDGNQRLLPFGAAGEIYIGGDGVSPGYLHDVRQERFVEDRYSHGGGRLFRTGDIGRWMPGRKMKYLGRNDHQVKIKGYRIELQEIEKTLSGHEDVREVAVVAGQDESDIPVLLAYVVREGAMTASDLRSYIRLRLPEYMVPAHFIFFQRLPLTPNGKPDKAALAADWKKYMVRVVRDDHGRTPMERKLLEICKEVLASGEVAMEDDFFDLGGHSIKALRLIARIRREFNVRLSIRNIFQSSGIEGIAGRIRSARQELYQQIMPAGEQASYDLSEAQKRVWLSCQFEGNNRTYNIPIAFMIKQPVERNFLEQACRGMIERHDTLRTSFFLEEDQPRQKVLAAGQVAFEVASIDVRLPGKDLERSLQEWITEEIDLQKAPLLKVLLVCVAADRYILVFNIHHIIADGVSLKIIVKELFQAYAELAAGREPSARRPENQYKDYVAWEKNRQCNSYYDTCREHWLLKFKDAPAAIELSSRTKKGMFSANDGNVFSVEVDESLFDMIRSTAADWNATTFSVLVAGINLLLNIYSGSDDIVIALINDARSQIELEDQVGLYTGFSPLRTVVRPDASLYDMVTQVQEGILDALEFNLYSYADLVKDLFPDRKNGTAFSDIVVQLQDLTDLGKLSATTLSPEPYNLNYKVSHFKLNFDFYVKQDGLVLNIRFSSAYYDMPWISNAWEDLRSLLEKICLHRDGQAGDKALVRDVVREFKDHALPDVIGDMSFSI
ncbi:amino acid adenylation domain-containing protein [Flavitalea sp. BT771]|uniref:non-ribosomal peptide synthetase n=1 Tax=Flavitalea sp. BT771 TaxID=3063329 RepID=UPI0026E438E6|nr:non-ribosomal peptide synthetase [Flavitalea sp. BT771]MDO6435727.1 amino acid adenylation domain-containing protein [Flavitalea sp. BT771]MDV6224620.1 amino acid adenylation domain-containing protein [Flavitalea sp. BT771]